MKWVHPKFVRTMAWKIASRGNEETVHKGQSRLLHVFVTEVRDSMRLETHNRAPAFSLEQDTRLQRSEAIARHGGFDVAKDLEVAAQQELL